MQIDKETLAKAVQGIEVKKHAYRQTREGTIVSFLIQPDDVAELLGQELSVSEIGARYMLGIVRLDEETDYPVIPEEVTIGERAMRRAVMLCKDPSYQSWVRLNIHSKWANVGMTSEEVDSLDDYELATHVMRSVCEIISRKDFKTDKIAQSKFRDHVDDYLRSKK
tara:strand:+ start:1043 stop:1540 length:498 start_codon:yes stop_codon:yes gene_type:complete